MMGYISLFIATAFATGIPLVVYAGWHDPNDLDRIIAFGGSAYFIAAVVTGAVILRNLWKAGR